MTPFARLVSFAGEIDIGDPLYICPTIDICFSIDEKWKAGLASPDVVVVTALLEQGHKLVQGGTSAILFAFIK